MEGKAASDREGLGYSNQVFRPAGGCRQRSVATLSSLQRYTAANLSSTRLTGELFALTPYAPSKTNTNGGVEAVLDSSRYFVLTVVDVASGQKA